MDRTLKSCLVVDDSKLVRLVARKILKDLDVEAIEAASGAEALDLCDETMPDAILVDWNMPGMDGLAFLRRMRRMPGGKKPLVVFCTTEDDEAHRRQALAAGADQCVLKPFDGETIRTKFFQTGLM